MCCAIRIIKGTMESAFLHISTISDPCVCGLF
jgi:hypothetical protein